MTKTQTASVARLVQTIRQYRGQSTESLRAVLASSTDVVERERISALLDYRRVTGAC